MDGSSLPPFFIWLLLNIVAGKLRSKLFFLTRKFMPGIHSDMLKAFVQQSQPALLILGVHEISPPDGLGFVVQILPLGTTEFWKHVGRGPLHPLESLRNF